MDELFNIIGRLYTDIYSLQRVIEELREQVNQKEKEIESLKKENDRS